MIKVVNFQIRPDRDSQFIVAKADRQPTAAIDTFQAIDGQLGSVRKMFYNWYMPLPTTSLNKKDIKIESMLRARGIYPTSQRLAIANTLFSKHQHITAEQLHNAVCQTDSRVSMATIYNALKLFVKRGLLREIFIDTSRTFYDSNTSHHHHFYNVDTDDLNDMPDCPPIHFSDENLPQGTTIESVDIVIRVRTKAS